MLVQPIQTGTQHHGPGEDLRSEGTHGSVPMLDLSVALNRGTR